MAMSPVTAGSLVGERLGKYRLLALIAVGGTAAIYLARIGGEAGFQKYVVVKCLLDHLADDSDFLRMFLDEARLCAQLDHSNIVQTLELGQHEGRYYIVMEYLAGMPLAQLARKTHERTPEGLIPTRIVLGLAAQACAGLHYAHMRTGSDGAQLNVVHRDVSPQNLVVTFEGMLKIVDFGIAKADRRQTHTRSGTIKGKFAYMSPEQCLAEPLDRRTDVFALGTVVHELLTARRLFKRASTYETYQAILRGNPPPPSRHNSTLDEELDRVVLRALAHAKEDRYETTEAFGEAMLSWLHSRGQSFSATDVSRFLERVCAQELEEHAAHMRRLISGHQIATDGKLRWDSPAEEEVESLPEGAARLSSDGALLLHDDMAPSDQEEKAPRAVPDVRGSALQRAIDELSPVLVDSPPDRPGEDFGADTQLELASLERLAALEARVRAASIRMSVADGASRRRGAGTGQDSHTDRRDGPTLAGKKAGTGVPLFGGAAADAVSRPEGEDSTRATLPVAEDARLSRHLPRVMSRPEEEDSTRATLPVGEDAPLSQELARALSRPEEEDSTRATLPLAEEARLSQELARIAAFLPPAPAGREGSVADGGAGRRGGGGRENPGGPQPADPLARVGARARGIAGAGGSPAGRGGSEDAHFPLVSLRLWPGGRDGPQTSDQADQNGVRRRHDEPTEPVGVGGMAPHDQLTVPATEQPVSSGSRSPAALGSSQIEVYETPVPVALGQTWRDDPAEVSRPGRPLAHVLPRHPPMPQAPEVAGGMPSHAAFWLRPPPGLAPPPARPPGGNLVPIWLLAIAFLIAAGVGLGLTVLIGSLLS